MQTDIPTCPACGVALVEHWQCTICRCLGHKNVQARGDKGICQDCDTALERRSLRRCKVCETVKPVEKFRVVNTVYRRRECKACYRAKHPVNREQQRAWLERNREEVNARARARYWANPEKHRSSRRASYWRNLAYYRAYNEAYWQRPDKKERRSRLARENRARIQERRKLYNARKLLRVLRGER